jgi:hypothetical protein
VEWLQRPPELAVRLSWVTSDPCGEDAEDIAELTPPERRTLELHRAIAARIQQDPDGVRRQALANLNRRREADTQGNGLHYIAAWATLLAGPPARLIDLMVSTDQAARDLRQSSPFAGVLSDEERLDILRRWATCE